MSDEAKFAPVDVCGIVGIGPRRLKNWRDAGVLVPSSNRGAHSRYTTRDVAVVAAAWKLSQSGVTTQQLRDLVPMLPEVLDAVTDAVTRADR